MVDSNLVEEIKEIGKTGIRKPSDAYIICEFVKQMVEESNYIGWDYIGWDLGWESEEMSPVTVQVIILNRLCVPLKVSIEDISYGYWLKKWDNWIDCGEGLSNNPDDVFYFPSKMWLKMFSGKSDHEKFNPEQEEDYNYISKYLVVHKYFDDDEVKNKLLLGILPIYGFIIDIAFEGIF